MPKTKTKKCPRCQQTFDREYFGTMSNGQTKSKCPPCHKAYQMERDKLRWADPDRRRKNRNGVLRARYGITIDEYERMVEEQGNKCAICGGSPQGVGNGSRLHVDHSHITGKVRGLLCTKCNVAIGMLDDNYEKMHAAIAYLIEYEGV